MAAIGSLVFCTDCGNLLDGSSGDEKVILRCDVCGTENTGTALSISQPALTEMLMQPHRYINECHYHQVKAHSFPLRPSLKAFCSTDVD